MDYSTKLVSNSINNIYVYTRVSTRKQSTDKKYGLLYQKELCDDYIKKFHSLNNGISYWDDIGSSYKSKLILKEMGEMIRKLKPNSLILISEVSRLGRNYPMVKSILKLVRKKKAFIISICENLVYGQSVNKDKEFIHKVIDSEKESDVLSMRIKNTQSYIKKNGGYIGKAPFGYKIIKNCKNIPILKENSEDFVLIDYIVNFANDCYSYDEISNIMNKKGLLSKDKLWNSIKIKKILNKFYPEHMFLNITKKYKSKSLITIKDEKISYDISDDLCDDISYDISDDISDDVHNDVYNDVYNFSDKSSVKQIPNFKSRFENTPFECLTITISNDINKKRIFSYSSSSNISPCIKLRSGRIINKI